MKHWSLRLRLAFAMYFIFTIAACAEPMGDSSFRVAVLAPLSGQLSEYGIAAKNGIELARQDAPKLFDKISFHYEDTKWDAGSTVRAFQSTRARFRPHLLMNWGNPTSEAIVPLIEKYKIPSILLSSDPNIMRNSKFSIRSIPSSKALSHVLTQHLINSGYKRIGVVIAENSYVEGLYEGIANDTSRKLDTDIIERLTLDNYDFASTVSKIKKRDYDAIGVFLITGQISKFYRELKRQKVSLPTFGSDFFESRTEIHNSQGAMEGAVFPNITVSDSFRKKYINQYKNDLQISFAGNWYDVAMTIGHEFKGGRYPHEPSQVIKKILSTNRSNGVCGDYSVASSKYEGKYFSFPVVLKKIVNLEIEEV